MLAERLSHATSSKGCSPGWVKYRFQGKPLGLRRVPVGALVKRSEDVFEVERAMNTSWRRRIKGVKRRTLYEKEGGLSSILPQPAGAVDNLVYKIWR
jgi:hypothetical protein